jgi:hypothetical protein
VVVQSEALFWVIEVALMAVAVLVGLVAGVVAFSAVVRGQGRGYRPAGLTTAVLVAVFGAGIAGIPALWSATDRARPSPPLDLLPTVTVLPGVAAALVGAVVAWSVTDSLPPRLVVMQPGRTRSMRWELEHVADRGLQGRFFVLTPPGARFPELTRRATVLADRIYGWHPPSWSEFLGELAEVGLVVGSDPGPGAVIGFRGDGGGIVVARDLHDPLDFADAMLQHAG